MPTPSQPTPVLLRDSAPRAVPAAGAHLAGGRLELKCRRRRRRRRRELPPVVAEDDTVALRADLRAAAGAMRPEARPLPGYSGFVAAPLRLAQARPPGGTRIRHESLH